MNIGDVVRLKSGGPLMVVSYVDNDSTCTCVWFSTSDATSESVRHFPQSILELVN